MVAKLTAKVDLTRLNRFRDIVDSDLRLSGNGPVRKALKQWGFRYRTFSRRRWLTQSKGGGAWPKLKASTIKGRRKRTSKILLDTATMIGGFTPTFSGKPGQIEKKIKFGIKVGVGGSGQHPSGQITLGELYKIHHFGLGRVPVRKLVVKPNTLTIKGMTKDMRLALNKAHD